MPDGLSTYLIITFTELVSTDEMFLKELDMDNRNKKINILMGFALTTLVALPTPLLADPPPWAPAHGHRAKKHHKHKKQYSYVYYPSSQVYYRPEVKRYYYMNNGVWTQSASAPVQINLGKSVSINLGGSIPYVYHPNVIQEYPVIITP